MHDFHGLDNWKEHKDVLEKLKKQVDWDMHLSVIEWLAMQDPLKDFEPHRPALPGMSK